MNLSHHFLVSMPQLQDDYFGGSLVYILDHDEKGAFGVIVNKALDLTLKRVFSQLSIATDDTSVNQQAVLCGGPVDEGHGLVLHPHGVNFESTRNFSGGVSLSSSRDILESIARGQPPGDYLIILGHSGWAPGQLESEMLANAWLSCDATTDILFDIPLHLRRQAVGDRLGVDLTKMVGHSGRA